MVFVKKSGRSAATLPLNNIHDDRQSKSIKPSKVQIARQTVSLALADNFRSRGYLRGKDPLQRAELIIDNCVHPDFKDQLRDYMGRIKKVNHQPFSLSMAYGMHRQFEKTGDMRGINWADYC